jgi:hypothetical protein
MEKKLGRCWTLRFVLLQQSLQTRQTSDFVLSSLSLVTIWFLISAVFV